VSTELWASDPRWRPPAALIARLDAIMERYGERSGRSRVPCASEDPDARVARYLTVAERLLDDLITQGCAQRETALDLLAADALVTYAFEAASEDPGRLQARAAAAMRDISSVAAAGGDAASTSP
jgi:hypothetical protein